MQTSGTIWNVGLMFDKGAILKATIVHCDKDKSFYINSGSATSRFMVNYFRGDSGTYFPPQYIGSHFAKTLKGAMTLKKEYESFDDVKAPPTGLDSVDQYGTDFRITNDEEIKQLREESAEAFSEETKSAKYFLEDEE